MYIKSPTLCRFLNLAHQHGHILCSGDGRVHTASYWWSANRGTQQGPCHPREQHPCRWLCQPGGGDHV